MPLLEFVIGGVIVLVILILIANRAGNTIVVTPTALTAPVNTPMPLSVTIWYTPFPRWFRKTKRTQGTVTVASGTSVITISPISGSTSHSTPASFTVVGVLGDTKGKIVVDATSRHGTHSTVTVDVTIP